MTAYTTISDATLTANKPLTQSVTRALRDNAIAISEGSASAPKIQTAAYQDASITAAKLAADALGYGAIATKLTSGSWSSVATGDIVLTSYSTYVNILILLYAVRPASNGARFQSRVSTNGGSSYDSGGGNYVYSIQDNAADSSASASSIYLTGDGVSNNSSRGLSMQIYLPSRNNTALRPYVQIDGLFPESVGNVISRVRGQGERTTAQDTDAFRFQFDSGNISVGNYVVYGYN